MVIAGVEGDGAGGDEREVVVGGARDVLCEVVVVVEGLEVGMADGGELGEGRREILEGSRKQGVGRYVPARPADSEGATAQVVHVHGV